jgi:type III restriction enzyme
MTRTQHSHVNDVVIDSGWEGRAAKVLDDLTDEGHVNSWVKNAFLDFRVPYTDNAGEQRDYLPDFIVNCRLAGGRSANIVVEVTGFDRDKEAKRWTIVNRWLPAVNRIRNQHGWDKWDFLELDEQRAVADFRNLLLARLRELALAEPVSGVWAARRDDELKNGLWMDDFEIPERRVDLERWAKNPLDD